ncbi:MAG: tetratricopeptide repeat protein [Rhodospirillales bacterium]|nr:tetratricopeptide repeat protein [Acetobacter sp.]
MTSSLLDFVRVDYPAVIRKVREAMVILTTLHIPPHDIGIVHSRILLGLALTRTGHPEEGEPLLRAQPGEENLDDSFFDQTFGDREAALGECLLAEKRYAEAEPLLLTGLANLEKRLGPQNRLTQQTRQRLRDLYLAWSKPAEAARYEPKATIQTAPTP